MLLNIIEFRQNYFLCFYKLIMEKLFFRFLLRNSFFSFFVQFESQLGSPNCLKIKIKAKNYYEFVIVSSFKCNLFTWVDQILSLVYYIVFENIHYFFFLKIVIRCKFNSHKILLIPICIQFSNRLIQVLLNKKIIFIAKWKKIIFPSENIIENGF